MHLLVGASKLIKSCRFCQKSVWNSTKISARPDEVIRISRIATISWISLIVFSSLWCFKCRESIYSSFWMHKKDRSTAAAFPWIKVLAMGSKFPITAVTRSGYKNTIVWAPKIYYDLLMYMKICHNPFENIITTWTFTVKHWELIYLGQNKLWNSVLLNPSICI